MVTFGLLGADEFHVDFREVPSLPAGIVPGGELQAGDLRLETVDGEQVLAVDLTDVSDNFGATFNLTGLDLAVNDTEPLYLVFHYIPHQPKADDGLMNFRVTMVVNGIGTVWNSETSSGVINQNLPVAASVWRLALIDLQPLLSHWRRQTGSTEPMRLQTLNLGPGSTGQADKQYRDKLFFRGFLVGPNPSTMGVTYDGDAPNGNATWIPHGDRIMVQPFTAGNLYVSKVRQPYAFYTNESTGRFDETEYARHASIQLQVTAAQTYQIDTNDFNEGPFNQVSGSYEILLVNEGSVESVHPFHLAFKQLPVSPDYAVLVRTAGSADYVSVPTWFSYMQREYVKSNADDTINSIKLFNPGHPEQLASHSFAGFSTDDYPISVRVQVLGHAFAPNTYFDDTPRISRPLTSAKVIPSSYNIEYTLPGADVIEFTLEEPRKVLVVPNYEKGMQLYRDLAEGYDPVDSFEIGIDDVPWNHPMRNVRNSVSEGFKNPLIFLARSADTFPEDHGFSKEDSATLVIQPGDQPAQEDLSAAEVVWFEPGPHDLSRLGEYKSYKTFIEAGQIIYLEEGAFVAAGFKKRPQPGRSDKDPGGEDSFLIGRGIVTGINHYYGGVPGFWHGNGIAIEVNVVDGITFTDRANYGITGGDLIQDVANLGAWHGNTGGVDFIDHCTVRDSFLTAADDNLKVSDHTFAEDLVIMQLTNNAHAIMVHEMVDDVTYANTVVKDSDIIGVWQQLGRSTWKQLSIAAITCIQSRNVTIKDFTFSDIRIESPYVHRILSFTNLYKKTPQGMDGAYTAEWFSQTSETHHSRIEGFTLENISVTTPLIIQESLLGSAYANSFDGLTITQFVVNGVPLTEANLDDFFEISGYVLGTDPSDGGNGRVDIPNPITNLTIHESLYSAWESGNGLLLGPEGDEDLDGLANLAEFALGGDPKNPADRGQLPSLTLSNGSVQFTYPVLDQSNPGIDYAVQQSSDLKNWVAVPGTLVRYGYAGGMRQETLEISNPSTDKIFIRLKINME
jgi:hypothetical protein